MSSENESAPRVDDQVSRDLHRAMELLRSIMADKGVEPAAPEPAQTPEAKIAGVGTRLMGVEQGVRSLDTRIKAVKELVETAIAAVDYCKTKIEAAEKRIGTEAKKLEERVRIYADQAGDRADRAHQAVGELRERHAAASEQAAKLFELGKALKVEREDLERQMKARAEDVDQAIDAIEGDVTRLMQRVEQAATPQLVGRVTGRVNVVETSFRKLDEEFRSHARWIKGRTDAMENDWANRVNTDRQTVVALGERLEDLDADVKSLVKAGAGTVTDEETEGDDPPRTMTVPEAILELRRSIGWIIMTIKGMEEKQKQTQAEAKNDRKRLNDWLESLMARVTQAEAGIKRMGGGK